MDGHFDAHGTTILSVRRNGVVAMGGDGQVTLGSIVMKGNARKVRRLHDGRVLAGFAGGTADACTLFERFGGKLEKYGNLARAEDLSRYILQRRAVATVTVRLPLPAGRPDSGSGSEPGR